VDALAHLLYQLPPEQQATVGLPWMDHLVLSGPVQIAGRSYLLPEWLEQVRPHTTTPALLASWHRIVDALTVAGDDRIAALAVPQATVEAPSVRGRGRLELSGVMSPTRRGCSVRQVVSGWPGSELINPRTCRPGSTAARLSPGRSGDG
jgi:hypothetical protein